MSYSMDEPPIDPLTGKPLRWDVAEESTVRVITGVAPGMSTNPAGEAAHVIAIKTQSDLFTFWIRDEATAERLMDCIKLCRQRLKRAGTPPAASALPPRMDPITGREMEHVAIDQAVLRIARAGRGVCETPDGRLYCLALETSDGRLYIGIDNERLIDGLVEILENLRKLMYMIDGG